MHLDRVRALIIAVLLVATAVVYWRCLDAKFVAWDDDINVYNNPHIWGLDGKRLAWMFTDTQAALRYKPLSWLAWALIYSWIGLDPFGFHLANLLLHCLNTVLVFAVLRALFADGGGQDSGPARTKLIVCGWAALLWALHPLRVEPVAWVTGLPYGLSLFFLLISLLFYLHHKNPATMQRQKVVYYWASVGSFLLASLSYPLGLTYPLALVALDTYRSSRTLADEHPPNVRQKFSAICLQKLPFFIVAAVLILLTLHARVHADGIWPKARAVDEFGIFPRAMQAFYVWAYYAWKFWIPLDLSPVYLTLISFKPMAWPFVASAAGTIALTALLAWKRRKVPFLLAIWVCHLVLLIPMLGLTEHPHFTSDRYAYGPGVLWSIALAAITLKLLDYNNRRLVIGVTTAALLTCAFLTAKQVGVWHDDISLFRHALRDIPPGTSYYFMLQKRLAMEYTGKKRYPEALACYSDLLKIDSGDVGAHQAMASILFDLDRFKEAGQHYLKLLRVDPQNARYHNHLGIILAAGGDLPHAIEQFRAALELQPEFVSANRNMATALSQQGRIEEARVYSQKAIGGSTNKLAARQF